MLAWRNLKSFRQEARFSTWLYRIATNCWLAQARKRQEELLGDRDDDVADADADATDSRQSWEADHAAASTMKIDLERAMALLSDAERAAIVQCYHNDLSHEEAAYVLGCPVGTVKTHVLRGKAKLKRALAAWAPSQSAWNAMNTVNPDAADSRDAPADWMDRLLVARCRRAGRRLHRRRRDSPRA